jgi:hypothetical protein
MSIDSGSFRKNSGHEGEAYPGPMSFADFGNRPVRRVASLASNADSIMDEETIHWRVLFTRIFLIILLLLVIVCLGLYDLNPSFLFLAIFICGFLVICLVATFVDLSFIWRRCLCMKAQEAPAGGANVTGTNSSDQPSTELHTQANIEAPTESPFGNYHNRL